MIRNVSIPMPLQVVIDDVGWRTGRDGHLENQPWRTGIERDHVPDDYRAIVQLGRELGVRPQAAMILSEWDDANRLRDIPTASWQGTQWDNSQRVGPWLSEAAQIIGENRDHFELALHGLGHEYWQDGQMTRAEWHDEQGNMRPRDQVLARLELFYELVEHHRLGALPRAFVPCAFMHHFAHPTENLAQILRSFGIESISTPFFKMHRTLEPMHPLFGFDHGVMTIDRGRDVCNWRVMAPEPTELPPGPIVGMHWPQLLHPEPARNAEVVVRWVKLLGDAGRQMTHTLAPHTDAMCAQLAYHATAKVSVQDSAVVVDASPFFALPWARVPAQPMVIKIAGDGPIRALRDERGELLPVEVEHAGGAAHVVVRAAVTAERASVKLQVVVGGGDAD